jgi:hypothetical protein
MRPDYFVALHTLPHTWYSWKKDAEATLDIRSLLPISAVLLEAEVGARARQGGLTSVRIDWCREHGQERGA